MKTSEQIEMTIDTALDSGRVTASNPEERELQELALALRAESEAPSPEFATRMDTMVSEGFPRPEKAAGGFVPKLVAGFDELIPRRITPRLAGGLAATVLAFAVGTATISQSLEGDVVDTTSRESKLTEAEPILGGDDQAQEALSDFQASDSSAATAAPEPGRLKALGEGGAAPRDLAVVPPNPGGGESLGARERKVQRSASMTIGAPADELTTVGRSIADTARRHDGFVLSSTLTTGEAAGRGGYFDLRVPVGELDATIAELSDLGEVRALTQDELDVTSSFESVEDQLKAALAERRGLLRRLENAATDTEAATIRSQLRRANRDVDSIRAQQRQLERQTAFAGISVTLEKGSGETGSATAEAFDDAIEILTGALGLLIRALAVLIPLALVGGVAYAAGRRLRRRRRESALD
ncbi:MAG: DUF4349 domain-containing protein [Thermoleophilaceae bacterium]|nr:DUF4349 domain-containing protein [Thermoleophilaceae bacterium]